VVAVAALRRLHVDGRGWEYRSIGFLRCVPCAFTDLPGKALNGDSKPDKRNWIRAADISAPGWSSGLPRPVGQRRVDVHSRCLRCTL